ncbi:MAG TPA: alpha/beta hydrolase, partial [Candidatus Nitrosocosmicus sp.]|nr:alpha/beta hydrolase [Candidatus Nitrosocosmicus sp.]
MKNKSIVIKVLVAIVFATSLLSSPQLQPALANKHFDIYKIPIQKASVGDIDIAYKKFGNGTNTILLISGGSNTMNFWDPYLLSQLAKNYTIVVFDSRGIGNTSSGEKPFSIKQFANDTAGLLEAIGVTAKVDVMGFSLGSLIAQEVAYMHQDKVNRLMLYGSMCGGKDAVPPSPVLQNFTNALQDPARTNSTSDPETYGILDDVLFPIDWMQENPDYMTKIPRQGVSINASDATKLLGAFMSWTQTESCDKLSAIKVPTLVIVGTEDVVTVPENSLNLVKGIPGAWLIQIEDGGHGVMF